METQNGGSRALRHDPEANAQYEPKSVAGQISIGDMGTRSLPPTNADASDSPQSAATRPRDRPNAAEAAPVASYSVSADLNFEQISYRPTSAENQASFERLTATVRDFLPDEPHGVILSAADAILETIKDVEKPILQKRLEIDGLLALKLDDQQIARIITQVNEITDYGAADDEENADDFVAVTFDEENEADSATKGEEIEEPLEKTEQDEQEEDGEDGITEVGPQTLTPAIEKAQKPLTLGEVKKDTLFARLSALEPEKETAEVLEQCKSISKALNDRLLLTRALEDTLMEILQFQHLEFVKFCVENRDVIVYGIELLHDRKKTIETLRRAGRNDLLAQIGEAKKRRASGAENDQPSTKKQAGPAPLEAVDDGEQRQPKIVDLEALTFDQGPQLMATAKIVLPKGLYQQNKKLYDTIVIPAPAPPPLLDESGEKLVLVSEMPDWIQPAFPAGETSSLNRIQLKVYPCVSKTDDNILLCAPTGAGKTNVALLAILRVLENHRDPKTGKLDTLAFKCVYIAPLKALVAEQTREFERRLALLYGLVVNELTGDLLLSQKEVRETQILVTTPEKWDVVTRKADLARFLAQVRLLIIDEIHLLHDDRGPVLESVIVRAKRAADTRLVGLSATLPNYEDVARFLQVKPSGLFYFDSSFRPCPLVQHFIGIKEKKAIKKVAAMNEACYEKLVECRQNGHQMIIFVHSRKDTVKTARWLGDKAAEAGLSVTSTSAGTQELLRQESENCTNRNLAEILPGGFGVHHAGLNRSDRALVEDLFAQGHVQVLVSTATLAWGVNLPAHTVVIKGTETYNAEKGQWTQLSPQNILQMLGRAGRPRYDTLGEGVIITAHEELQYYMAILNQQLPIESQMMRNLVDALNAEVVLGAVKSRADAVSWFAETYLYIRMLALPKLYQVGAEDDELLYWKRVDLVHSAFVMLDTCQLLTYENGAVSPKELGRIAAHFYIGHESVAYYNNTLRAWMSEIDVLRVLARSAEFKHVPVRQEEKFEVARLGEKCPIPIKDGMGEPTAKISILLQAYISRLRLDGFALTADMVHVTQSGGRLLRALHEICLAKKWASLAEITLDLCKCVERRMWNTNSPFRQFGALAPPEIVRASEASHLPFISYFQLGAAELAEAINFRGHSELAHELLQKFPRISLQCQAQPISQNLVRISVEISPEWVWDRRIHSRENFLLIVLDCDGQKILYDEIVPIDEHGVARGLAADFTVPTHEPLPPNLYVTLTSDKWMHSQWRAPVKMYNIRLPKKPALLTEVLDVQSVPTAALKNEAFSALLDFDYFNKFQSQCFHALYNTNENVFLGLSKGSGKTTMAEVAILHAWRQNKQKILYLQPLQVLVDSQARKWAKFSSLTEPPKIVSKLSGDLADDAKTFALAHLILATPAQFDAVSRRWRQRKSVQNLDLIIADDAHMVGLGKTGAVYETVLSRMRFVAAHLARETRFLVLSHPLIYGREFADWLGCKKNTFNFEPMSRAQPIKEISVQPYKDENLLLKMGVDALESLSSALVFMRLKKVALALFAEVVSNTEPEALSQEVQLVTDKISDVTLRKWAQKGVALFHGAMVARDRLIVERLFAAKHLKYVFATPETCVYAPRAENVVILGSHDLYLNDMLEMLGCCHTGRVQAFLYAPKIPFYTRFMSEPMPVESNLQFHANDAFMHEISAGTFHTKQGCVDWLTYTLFYRRVTQNPSFYGLEDYSHVGISEYLSELVETTLEELEKPGLIEIEEEDEEEETISPLNGAMIAAHYLIPFRGMEKMALMDEKARLRAILETVTSACDVDDNYVRPGEETQLERLAQQVPLKLAPGTDFVAPAVKVFLLLQAHLLRIRLLADLAADQHQLLPVLLRTAHAAADVLSGDGRLNALQAMDLSQMIVQGMWTRDLPLLQLPHISREILQRCTANSVETVYDLLALDDDVREDVLRLDENELSAVAAFANQYPNIDAHISAPKTIGANAPALVTVTVERDEEPDTLEVQSARYGPKKESWWLVVGDRQSRQLYGVKKTALAHETQQVEVEFSVPTPGHHELAVWVMCDSYIDVDKELDMVIDVEPEAEE